VVILWMGIGSPFFTRRIAAPVETVIQQTQSHYAEEAARPANVPAAALNTPAQQDSVRRVVSR